MKGNFYIFHAGCRLNRYETDALTAGMEQEGFTFTENLNNAEYIIFNTCTVTNRADSKSRTIIRRLARENPQAKIIVTGCYATTDAQDVQKLPGVFSVIPNDQKALIPENLAGKVASKDGFFGYPIRKKDGFSRAYLKIQDGCNRTCSYCKIPQARGEGRSRNFYDILDEAKNLIDLGFHELVITGVNIGWYHSENHDIYSLLEHLLQLSGNFYIRLSSIEPGEVNERLAEILTHPKMANFLHVPVQSGSKYILRKMRRGYTPKSYLEKIGAVKKQNPNIHIGTDIIVGFPSETEQDFQDTITLVEEVEFANIHVFPFSMRRHTPVEKMHKENPQEFPLLHGDVIRNRVSKIILLKNKLDLLYRQKTAGITVRGIVEKLENNTAEILTENYLRVMADAQDKVRQGDLVFVTYNEKLIGNIHASQSATEILK
ncbi:MAG: tRNA (N(6)-L-threonylcarbamoyladenosine(37)-C(2))-methylthiotransferase MtaB [Candidatus Hydrogenedentota bacterium]|nr:MAG: tRNA (N(6)-L-threonylcarbamoyladenosine(37)-C(2))-methylthiotransferase MtaB [Candidatus Hydrogenedentota bacterium]